MLIKTVKVSDKGQIAIPQGIRNLMGINRGDELIVITKDDKILLEKVEKVSQKIKDDFKDIISYSESSLKEIWDNEEDDIWSSYLE